MKKILCSLSIVLFTTLNLGADLLSGSENLNLDFADAVDSIQKVSQSTEPMAKHLEMGIKDLNKTIDKVKGDPNLLNKSEFELAFAKHVRTLVTDIDSVVSHRQEIEWAFEDISLEVKNVIKRLDHNNEKIKEKISRQAENIDNVRKQLRKMAREIERLGSKASADMKREFKRLHRKFKLLNTTMRTQKTIQKQLHRTLAGLGTNGGSIANGARDLSTWFENLNDQRDAFLSLAETRKDMAALTKLVTSGGANSIMATFSKLRGIQGQLSKFNDTFEKMDENLEVLSTFNPDDMSLEVDDGSIETGEPWKEFLD